MLARCVRDRASSTSEASDYIASRIVETNGSEGNIKGLLAEITLMKQPQPTEPPGNPPPGEEPPPGTDPGNPPPGTDPPPPVDPPKPGEEPKPDPKPDEPKLSEVAKAALSASPDGTPLDAEMAAKVADWVAEQAATNTPPQD